MAHGTMIQEKVPSATNHVLDYVFVVTRHGQRTPATQCTLLPKPAPEDYGQLTAYGREQMRALGRFLKDRYAFLLSNEPGELLVTHNKDQCTRDSVWHTLEGMGSPAVSLVLDSSNYDLLFDASVADNYQDIMDAASTGHFRTLKDLIEYVVHNAGSPKKSLKLKLLSLDSLLTSVSNGHPIPDWARPHWDKIQWGDKTSFTTALVGTERPMAAYLLTHILGTLSDRYEKGLGKRDKMHLFSVSDVNLYSLIKLLNPVYDMRPQFCATLLVEVFCNGGSMGAELFFAEDLDPVRLRLEKLSNPCSLEDLMVELRHLLNPHHTGSI